MPKSWWLDISCTEIEFCVFNWFRVGERHEGMRITLNNDLATWVSLFRLYFGMHRIWSFNSFDCHFPFSIVAKGLHSEYERVRFWQMLINATMERQIIKFRCFSSNPLTRIGGWRRKDLLLPDCSVFVSLLSFCEINEKTLSINYWNLSIFWVEAIQDPICENWQKYNICLKGARMAKNFAGK